jgi:hypothetical protein
VQIQLSQGQKAIAIAFDNLLQSTAIGLHRQGITFNQNVKATIIDGIGQFLYILDDEMSDSKILVNGELINNQSFESHKKITEWLNENSKVGEMIASLDAAKAGR